MEDVMV